MSKKIFLILFLLLFSVLVIVYFPTKYSFYEFKENVPEREDDWPIEIEFPPFGGCFSICWGFSTNKICSEYSRKYDYCTANCYGPFYNNCSGFWGSLFGKFLPVNK